ncbi:hypothetical protein MACJ_000802 [Theileria orientalis]|uniref:Vps53 N-terminal domain-containing protein n=1 Tax=Theileria orientalis TaxID=68886 RepID=A0A976M4N4_THEOR|nr:hypothetical protein MACJ_000802 [Theileria orientalis]
MDLKSYDLTKLLDNPVSFLNENFPDEFSFYGIDTLIAQLNEEIRIQDRSLITLFEQKAISGDKVHEKFENLQLVTNKLASSVKEIHERSKKGESSLKLLSSDIRALHNAKINICETIVALKRILMFSNMLEDLSKSAKSRNYREASGYVVVLRELRESLRLLNKSPSVRKLLNSCDSLLEKLKDQVIEDLEVKLGLKLTDVQHEDPLNVDDVCLCADSLGDEIREHISNKYSSNLKNLYQNSFLNSFDLKTVDNLNHRFSWFRRMMNEFDDNFRGKVPLSWGIYEKSTDAFVESLRTQLIVRDILSQSHQSLSANSLVSCLLRCREFEDELETRSSQNTEKEAVPQRAPVEFPEVLEPEAPAKKTKRPEISRMLSSCFEGYLGPWIASEEAQLSDLLSRIISDNDSAIMLVFVSARELFSSINARLQATMTISCEQALYEMFLVFKKVVNKYNHHLASKVYLVQRTVDLESMAKIAGNTIATCDYCLDLLDKLTDEIRETISQTFVELVTFGAEKEKVSSIKSDCFKHLLDFMCTFLPYTTNSQVEVSGPSELLLKNERLILKRLEVSTQCLPNVYLYHITNKIARNYLAHFKDLIFSLNYVSDGITQQLLLDAYEMRRFLTEKVKELLKTLPQGYLDSVSAEMEKLETLIKVLTAPDHSNEAYEALLTENGGSCTQQELDIILNIKRL